MPLGGAPDLDFTWFLERPGWIWDPFWGRFGPFCCEQWLDLCTALIAAENPSALSPVWIFSPSSAAVCAQHMESRFEKTCYFYRIRGRFFIVFRFANIEILCAQPVFCKDFLFFAFSDLASFLAPKNLPKTPPKPSRNGDKIESENKWFFSIHFFGFRPRFWRALDSQV